MVNTSMRDTLNSLQEKRQHTEYHKKPLSVKLQDKIESPLIPPRPVQTQRDRVIERATTQKPNYGIPTIPEIPRILRVCAIP